jgi:hypothetical protein
MIGKKLRASLRDDLRLILHILAAAGEQHHRGCSREECSAPRSTES